MAQGTGPEHARPRTGKTGSSPAREKRRTIFCLRGLLLVALGGMLVGSNAVSVGSAGLILLVLHALSNLVLLAAPVRLIRFPKIELAVGSADVVFAALAMSLAGSAAGVLPVSSLMMVLVVALGRQRQHAAAGAAAVSALHAWVVLGNAAGSVEHLPPQLLFLGSIALYFGFLTRGIHDSRNVVEAEELERHDLKHLLDILEAITSSVDLKSVMRTIVERTAHVVPATRCSILFVHEGEERCYVVASHDDPEIDMLEIELGKYPEVRLAIETRNPVLIRDVETDPLMSEVRQVLAGLDLHSILVVPMVFGSDLLGTLCMRASRVRHEFSTRETKFCMAVARVSANALKNAALYREVRAESHRHRRLGEKLSRIFDLSPGLILTTDNEGRITAVNAEAERLLGYSKDELVGRPCEVLFGDDGKTGFMARVRSCGMISDYPCRLRTRELGLLDIELNASLLKDESGEAQGTVWLGRDVTQLKATRTQLLQAKKLSTIGEVISGVAHELNNPLSGVLGFSELLLLREGEGHDRQELELIHDSALRCQKIVQNLLSFARENKPERKYQDVNTVIEKTLEMKRYQLNVNSIGIECDLDRTLPRTLFDFHQMQQVLLNLVNNAEQAMLRTARSRPSKLLVRSSHADGHILIEVTDTGEGMDQDTLERAFDPFFTTKAPGTGTGLGLAVSYGIVREHGGRIWARSREGEGSTFMIELPVGQPDEAYAERGMERHRVGEPAIRPGSRILVVDDEPLVLQLFVNLFEGRGYKVDTALNGKEALENVALKSYDLVVCDVCMPEMNGIELYPRLLKRRPELTGRLIFISGYLADGDTARFLAETNAPTLSKPIQITEVVRAVDEMLARPAAFAK